MDREEINLNDLRELVIYHPIEEEQDESDNGNDNSCNNIVNAPTELNTSNHSPVNKRKSRKRDSAALFDISLEDLTEPDFAGVLKKNTVKNSGGVFLLINTCVYFLRKIQMKWHMMFS